MVNTPPPTINITPDTSENYNENDLPPEVETAKALEWLKAFTAPIYTFSNIEYLPIADHIDTDSPLVSGECYDVTNLTPVDSLSKNKDVKAWSTTGNLQRSLNIIPLIPPKDVRATVYKSNQTDDTSTSDQPAFTLSPSEEILALFQVNSEDLLANLRRPALSHSIRAGNQSLSTPKNDESNERVVNLSRENKLLEFYGSSVSDKDIPCLLDVVEKEKNNEPLAGLKLLVNLHLDEATVLMVDLLTTLGADVTVTCMEPLFKNNKAVAALKSVGIKYLTPDELLSNFQYHNNYFDLICNCGINLGPIKPRLGIVELTHTEDQIYKESQEKNFIVTVDQSLSKVIETLFGTGDGCCRAIEQEISSFKEIIDNNRTFVIFGAGKVGTGILQSLLDRDVLPENIHVIDPNQTALNNIKFLNEINIYSLPENTDNKSEKDQANFNNIKNILKQADFIITATGVEECISKYFNKDDFALTSQKINMGTHDEWGWKFNHEEIKNNKKPYNFILERPTEFRFLDPTFALIIKACLQLAFLADKIAQEKLVGMHDYDDISKEYCFPYSDFNNVILWLKKYPEYECLRWEARNHKTLTTSNFSYPTCGLLKSDSGRPSDIRSTTFNYKSTITAPL